jgi:hypothetical protein
MVSDPAISGAHPDEPHAGYVLERSRKLSFYSHRYPLLLRTLLASYSESSSITSTISSPGTRRRRSSTTMLRGRDLVLSSTMTVDLVPDLRGLLSCSRTSLRFPRRERCEFELRLGRRTTTSASPEIVLRLLFVRVKSSQTTRRKPATLPRVMPTTAPVPGPSCCK